MDFISYTFVNVADPQLDIPWPISLEECEHGAAARPTVKSNSENLTLIGMESVRTGVRFYLKSSA